MIARAGRWRRRSHCSTRPCGSSLFLGPPGTGKSHLGQAIGRADILQGHRVVHREADGQLLPRGSPLHIRSSRPAEKICAVLIDLVRAAAARVGIGRRRVEVRIAVVIGMPAALGQHLLLTQMRHVIGLKTGARRAALLLRNELLLDLW